MTPERQQAVILEACPGVFVRALGSSSWNYRNTAVGRVLPCIDGDPLKDLNAMHEAEKTLDVNALSCYADELDKLCVPVHICPLTHWSDVVMATAAQRAEAFLRAIGKWEE